ncbi:MAG: YfcE family phosphodiesterase [Sphaerochaetaceae bacterium]|nr:YfcE family phosphodiesterase [Spirochaetales bacterium]MDY5500863.1 YfcE family phosphodiesterase [Sphaerochaetaceae bacterium]
MEGYLVASDIHGDREAFERLLELLGEHHVESMLVCGDLQPEYLGPTLIGTVEMTLVRGNCDSSYEFQSVGKPVPPLVRRIPWHGRTIVMTHGDRWPGPYGLSMREGDLFLFGHIHVPRLYVDPNGIIILNPGSAAYPRGGSAASYAILSPERIEIRSLWENTVLQGLEIEDRSAR